MPIWHLDALRRPLDFSQELSQVLYRFSGCNLRSLRNRNVSNQRKYSSIVATKCQPAAIYDLYFGLPFQTKLRRLHFLNFKPNLFQMKRSKEKVKVAKLSFIRIVDKFPLYPDDDDLIENENANDF